MVVQEIFQRDESLDVEEHSGQPLEIDNDQWRAIFEVDPLI